MKDINIPADWTFKSIEVANQFDTHVRSQLPWYDMATNIAAHVGRHYLPEDGLMYDVGASTGNMTSALRGEITKRNVKAVSLDYSEEMSKVWRGVGTFVQADARSYDFQPYDFCTCFLVLMFLPPSHQQIVYRRLYEALNPGGALLIFDKTDNFNGYLATVVHRLTLAGKVATNTPAEDIIRKELSLSGIQRPVNQAMFNASTHEIFRFGEFAGWVATK